MSFQPWEWGLPTQPEVFWNLRLNCMRFLWSLLLLSRFPAHWASCHLPCAGFSSCSASTIGAFAELGFCCTWPLPHGGRAEVVSKLNPSQVKSKSWHHRCQGSVWFPLFCLTTAKIWSDGWTSVTTQFMLGECVISLFLSHHSKKLKGRMDQCYNSVLFGKQMKIHPWSMRVSRPERQEEKRDPGSNLVPLFMCFFSSPLPNPM